MSITKGVFSSTVVANEPVCREHFRLVLVADSFPSAEPGQFVQVLCADPGEEIGQGKVLVRRPFSIGGMRPRNGRCELEILYRVIGPGTQWLSRLKASDAVSLLGPLGRPFVIPPGLDTAYLVGGGAGSPPLIWLAEAIRKAGRSAVAFCGARSADLLPLTRPLAEPTFRTGPSFCLAEFTRYDVPACVSTDDGSFGEIGRIPDIFARYLDSRSDLAAGIVVYTCGPEPMIRSVARICEDRNLSCQVCLERMMACGMGTCQSCVVRIRLNDGSGDWQYQLCCTDGPVFDSRRILWD